MVSEMMRCNAMHSGRNISEKTKDSIEEVSTSPDISEEEEGVKGLIIQCV